MFSERLRDQPVDPAHLDGFPGLLVDDHVRRYLMDGTVLRPAWTAARIAGSLPRLGPGR
jgi:hypothetical protein